MKKLFYFLCCQILAMIACNLFAQTTSFAYTNNSVLTAEVTNNPSTASNVFANAQTIGGYAHHSWAGGVTYNASNGISLFVNQSPAAGTAFYITYPFLVGSTYTISFTAKSDIANNSSLTLNASEVSLPNQYSTSGQTATSPDPYVIGYQLQGPGSGTFYPTTTSATYNISAFIPANGSNLNTFMIWAAGSIGTFSTAAITISNITITQVTPTFTLAVSGAAYNCGQTPAQTFTITNVLSSPGASYTYNLGANNGWNYNGSPAPSTITNAPASIDLTPVCGVAQSPVSATATIGSFQYNTNTVTVSAIAPSLAISGASSICGGTSTYTINNVPSCGGTVTWSVAPTGIVTPTSGSGGSITLSPTASGNVILTATVTSCGGTYTKSVPILVSSHVYNGGTDFVITGPSTACTNSFYDYSTTAFPDATNYTWSYPGAWTLINGGNGYPGVTIGTNAKTHGFVYVSVTNACGTGLQASFNVTDGTCSNRANNFAISPNPTTGRMQITPIKGTTSNSTVNSTVKTSAVAIPMIMSVRIADNKGTVRKTYEYGKSGTKNANIDLSGYQTGLYTISIFDGTTWSSQTILKQ